MKHLIALALLLAACDKGSDPATSSQAATKVAPATEQAATTAADPTVLPPGTITSCTDAEMTARMDRTYDAITAYFGRMLEMSANWKACDVVVDDLVALRPLADQFATEMMATSTWRASLSPTCRSKVKAVGEIHPKVKEVETRFAPLESAVEGIFTRCKDHPGFEEAAKKGIRLMRKKPVE